MHACMHVCMYHVCMYQYVCVYVYHMKKPYEGVNYRTVFFAEYNCSGPGSNTSARVNYSTLLNSTEAAHLLDVNYIDGLDWLLLNDAAGSSSSSSSTPLYIPSSQRDIDVNYQGECHFVQRRNSCKFSFLTELLRVLPINFLTPAL